MIVKRIDTFALSLPILKPVKVALEAVLSGENVLVRMETDTEAKVRRCAREQ